MSKELAKQLAPAYDKAPWANVEDDVSLCVWIKGQTGQDLALHEAAKLRKLIEAEVEKFPKVIVYVEGGVVSGCTSNDPRTRVVVIDRDNLKDEEDPEEAETKALEGHEDATHDVY